MNKDKNVNDMLDMLRLSVNDNDSTAKEDLTYTATEEYSEDALKKMLQEQFLTSKTTEDAYEISNEYKLDTDFLQEASSSYDEEPDKIQADNTSYIEDPLEAPLVKEAEVKDENAEETNTKEGVADFDVLFEDLISLQNAAQSDEETEESPLDDFFVSAADQADIAKTEEEILKDDPMVTVADEKADDTVIELKPLAPEESVEDADEHDYENDIVYHNIVLDAKDDEVISDEIQAKQEEPAESEHETYLAAVRKTGLDFLYDAHDDPNKDASLTIPDVSDNNTYIEEAEEEIVDAADSDENEELDLSTINLMMQFYDESELEKEISDKHIEKLAQSETVEEQEASTENEVENEYVDAKQNAKIQSEYKRKHLFSLMSVFGCIILSMLAIVLEFMLTIDMSWSSTFDHHEYQSVYVLIGLQFVIFTAAIHIKALYAGFKRFITLTPNRHSLVAVGVVSAVLYDICVAIALAITDDELPPLFNALTVLLITMSVIMDHLCLNAEKRSFAIYASEECKYTLVNERERGRIAKKMYAGGLSTQKSIYTINPVDFPSGFYRCVNDDQGKTKRLNFMAIPAIVIGIIASVISMIIDTDFYSAAVVFMISIFTILPIAWIYTDNVSKSILSSRLFKRGSAITGEYAIRNYEKCDIIVFSDLHMFKKCRVKDVGIAMYDTSVGYLTLGCIDALYSKIGGPLSGMQMQLPDVFKFDNVDIRRITRNGIEAIVDRKHALIVGERSFLQRYGINFPEDEKNSDRSTLCVSLNGGVTAKLSVKYETEPVFEMLVERLHSEGISCAIETYDPLINSEMLEKSRTLGTSPVSVVHKNSEDFKKRDERTFNKEPDSVIVCGSRLKLAELMVWIKRACKIERITTICSWGFSALGALVTIFVAISGFGRSINQYYLLLLLMAELGAVTSLIISNFPKKQYFTTAALYLELEKKHYNQIDAIEISESSKPKTIEKDNNTESDSNE